MPFLEAMVVYSTILSTFPVIRLAIIPYIEDDRVSSWQPAEAAFICLIIRPDLNWTATIAIATSGF